MAELMLDTANLNEIADGISIYPICGVTTNPSILKKEGSVDLYAHLSEIKKRCGYRTLHIQVVSLKTEDILEEAHCILNNLGKDTFIKVPVSKAGLSAIKALASEGVNVTATAVYSSMQGILSVLAGAKYIAAYYNRMENNSIDPNAVISDIRRFIDDGRFDAKILAASFRNVSQVVNAYTWGAQSATVPLDILSSALGMACIQTAVDDFTKDFESIHGIGKTMLNL